MPTSPPTWNQAAYEAALAKRQQRSGHVRWKMWTHDNGEDIRTLRAATILDLKVQGMPCSDIGKILGLHPDTISKETSWARKQGLVRSIEQQLLAESIPAAIRVMNEHIDQGSLKAAELALKLLKTFSDQSAAKDLKPSAEADPLDAYWSEVRAKAIDVQSRSFVGQLPAETGGLDAGPVAGLPAAAEAPCAGSADARPDRPEHASAEVPPPDCAPGGPDESHPVSQ